jgi:hypothetical protein
MLRCSTNAQHSPGATSRATGETLPGSLRWQQIDDLRLKPHLAKAPPTVPYIRDLLRTYTILYSATDQSGLTGNAARHTINGVIAARK